jgi:hypothetical protein
MPEYSDADEAELKKAKPKLEADGVAIVRLSIGAGFCMTLEFLETAIVQARANGDTQILMLIQTVDPALTPKTAFRN